MWLTSALCIIIILENVSAQVKQDKPSGVTIMSNNYYPRRPSNIEVQCLVSYSGYPKPQINWYINDMLMYMEAWNANGKFKHDFLIRSVNDGGEYTCEAKNIHGKASNSTDIKVIDSLKVLFRSIPETETIHNINDTVLTVIVSGTFVGTATLDKDDSGQPSIIIPNSIEENFMLKKAEYSIQFDVEDHLACDTVTKHNGRYKLLVSEEQRDGSTPQTLAIHFKVNVHYAPIWNTNTSMTVEKYIGDKDVSLRCDVCSEPVASCTWTLNGKILSKATRCIIQFSYLLEHHLGVYLCTATNRIDGQLNQQNFTIPLIGYVHDLDISIYNDYDGNDHDDIDDDDDHDHDVDDVDDDYYYEDEDEDYDDAHHDVVLEREILEVPNTPSPQLYDATGLVIGLVTAAFVVSAAIIMFVVVSKKRGITFKWKNGPVLERSNNADGSTLKQDDS